MRLPVALAAVAALAFPLLAHGATPSAGPQVLSIGVPPDPVDVKPGGSAEVLLRVMNAGPRAVTARISQRELTLGDNGLVQIQSHPDPRWRSVGFPTKPVTIPANGYRNVQVSVQVPGRIAPNLYFVGFVVTPAATGSGNLHVINQIGSFFTLNVPGRRLRRIVATLKAPSFALGGGAHGDLRVTNTGHAMVRYWGENDTKASPGRRIGQQRFDPSLLPVGESRTTTVTGHSAWPVGFVTMTVKLVYPGRTQSATREIVLTRRVFVIAPYVPVAAAVIAALGGWGVAYAIRKRRSRSGGN
jgi:hypothetical protein